MSWLWFLITQELLSVDTLLDGGGRLGPLAPGHLQPEGVCTATLSLMPLALASALGKCHPARSGVPGSILLELIS